MKCNSVLREIFLPHLLFQGVREAVKNARKWAKQAFRRLEARVLRPDKEKFQLVRGQEGEEGVRGESGDHTSHQEG